MSSCENYYWFSPNYWLCTGAGAMTSGAASGAAEGAFDGIGDQVEKSIDKIFDKFGEAATRGFDHLGETLTRAGSNFDVKDIAQKSAKMIKNFSSEFGSELGVDGSDVGSRIAKEMDKAFNGFWNDANLKQNTGRFFDELNSAFAEGVERADIAKNIKLVADEFDEGMKVFRQAFVKETDAFRSDIQGIFANMARDTTLRMVPWIALGAAVLTGTPLAVSYVYYKAKHNIGRPQLISEERRVGYYDRFRTGVSNTLSGIWSAAKPGLKWGGAAALAGIGLNATGNFDPAAIMPTAFAVGTAVSMFTTGTMIFKKMTAKKMSEYQPVFNKDLTEIIDNLSKVTYNLKKHDGYFQNLLLYGPGGTGKTMIAKYIARHSDMNYVMMSGGDLAQYIKRGEHVTELNKLFDAINNSSSPTILFIDEAESLCRDRDLMDKTELVELLNAFLNHTGEASKKFMIILTTNRVEDIDPAVLSRMDLKLHITPPEEEERKKIIGQYLPEFFSEKERATFFDEKKIGEIAGLTQGFTGRALFKLLNRMAGVKNATANNELTSEIIDITARRAVEQENKVVVMRAKAASGSARAM